MDLDLSLRPGEGLPGSAHRRLHAAGPVVWSDTPGGWVVSSYDAVREALGDVTRFWSQGTPVAEVFGTEGMLVNDTALHHAIRAVWARHVSREAMAARAGELEGYARAALETVRPRLAAGEAADFIPVFRGFVLAFIASSFAVPAERMGVIARWSDMSADTPVLELEDGSEAQQRHFAARQEVFDLIAQLVADRRRRFARGETPQDLTALMAAAEGRHGITASIVADNLFNFILGALDTTEKWLGNIMVALCTRPEMRARLSAEPALIERFNEEVMRRDAVVQVIQRRVRQDGAMLAGQRLREGDPLYVMTGAAGRDPARFTDPDRFDPDRPPQPHFGFGFGFHHCLGINIARQEARAFVKVALDACPALRIVEADYGDSWALWGPRRLLLAQG